MATFRHAQWIWAANRKDPCPYNQTIIARRSLKVKDCRSATVSVTADSTYRLSINGQWVNDGPTRSWPRHYAYDVIYVTPYLVSGENQIEIIANFLGVGTCHQVPQQPGLLFEMAVTERLGKRHLLSSDKRWEVALAKAWVVETLRRGNPGEVYDARLEKGLRFKPAAEICEARKGPWKGLRPREVALYAHREVLPNRYVETTIVERDRLFFHFPVARLLYPGVVEQSATTTLASMFATVLDVRKPLKLDVESYEMELRLDGRKLGKRPVALKPGRYLLWGLVSPIDGFWNKDVSIHFHHAPDALKLVHPTQKNHEQPWAFLPVAENAIGNDQYFVFYTNPERSARREVIEAAYKDLRRKIKGLDSFLEHCGKQVKLYSKDEMLVADPTRQHHFRRPLARAEDSIQHPQAMLADNAEMTTILPSSKGDVEVLVDLNDQVPGYFTLELIGEEGLIVDINAIEHIWSDGRAQLSCHLFFNMPFPNGSRLICRDGVNRFMGMRRRSGRYLYLTLRNQKRPVQIRKLGMMEALYPAKYQGRFDCSDPRLTRLWQISARTVEVCMEDTYVDCPLYEGTDWVGDARNESLYGYSVFGAVDIARHSMRLAAESLDVMPMVGSQVPSAWENILPAWSFLWSMSVWEYYEFSGDQKFPEQMWRAMQKNLKHAEACLTPEGLFSGPYWNMFDWAGVDYIHETVLHNSILMIGAIDATIKVGQLLKDKTAVAWLRKLRKRVEAGVWGQWDPKRKAFPDSIHADGTVSPSICQHNIFLALLYDIVPEDKRELFESYLEKPSRGMVRVGSPFALQFLLETLEKIGRPDLVLKEMREAFSPMLKEDSRTVWETLVENAFDAEFPTRSHAHAWSSSPVYFLNRVVLGIRPVGAGGERFEISPWVKEQTWARGATASIKGPVSVDWQRKGKRLEIQSSAPAGVTLRFVPNASTLGMEVAWNGKKIS